MNALKRLPATVALAAGAVAVPLAWAGTAAAAEDRTTGFPSTQSPIQAITAVEATLGNALYSATDALNGDNRPDGANGTESELPQLDPRLVEGPVGGLLVNGPLK